MWEAQDFIFQKARESDISVNEMKNAEHLKERTACLNWNERPYLKNVMQKAA